MSLEKDYEYIAGFYYNLSDRFGSIIDSEYDIFSYSLPGSSGYFVLTETGPLPLTLNAVKIEGTDNFTVIDKEGNKYYFNSSGFTTYLNNVSYKTSWHLTSIVSADGADYINFSYNGTNINGSTSQSNTWSTREIITVNDMKEGSYRTAGLPSATGSNTSQELSWKATRLTEISFKGGKVTFDIHSAMGYVTGIQIKDANGNVVKKFSLTQSFLDMTLMNNYKLDELSLVSGNNKTDTYKFEYYPSTTAFFYKKIDYWDYPNTNPGTLIPSLTISWCDYPYYGCSSPYLIGNAGATRQSQEDEMKKGVLKKITYPTGGSTEFIYEANKTKSVNNSTVFCGGLRIKQIKTTESAGQEILRTFEYGSDGLGKLVRYPDIREAASENIIWNLQGNRQYGVESFGHYRKRVFSSGFSPDAAYYLNQPIFYGQVTEYLGDNNNNQGKITYVYTDPYSDSYFSRLPLPSTHTTAWGSQQLSGLNYVPLYLPEGSICNLYTACFASLWRDRKLSKKTEFKREGNSYTTVKETTRNYQRKNGITLNGLKIHKYIHFPFDNYEHKAEEAAAKELGSPVFLYDNIQITTGVELLTSVTETDYLSGGNLSVNMSFSYDPDHNLLTRKSLLNSNGDTIINNTYYPFQTGYLNTELTGRNMYAVPVKETRNINGKTESVIRQYTNFGNNLVKLSKILTQQGSYPEEKRIEYLRYDPKGNPLHIVKDGTDQVIYIWGYNYQYPIAEIKGVAYSDVTGKITEAALNTIAAKNEPTSSDWTTINNLRTQLPNALITTYTYKPLVGIATMTDPRGVVTKYEYDTFGRLIKVTQSDKVIESYDYHYKN